MRLGTELQIVDQGDIFQFRFRRTALPPKLHEVKLAYPIRAEFLGNAQDWTPAFFEQFDVKNENADGKLKSGAGKISQPFVLGKDARKGVTRILFVGSR